MRHIDPPRPRLPRTRLILFTLMLVALLSGGIAAFENGQLDWRSLLINLSTEIVGAVITYFVIDRVINMNEDEEKLKVRLIREMENPDNGIAVRAVQELRTRGWLQDGSLYGWFLKRNNMDNLDLRDADLTGFGLYRSSLRNTQVYDAQLVKMSDLRMTIMPDGNIYDGRYCLRGDIDWALKKFELDFTNATAEEIAAYYHVPLEQFIEGQRWAVKNLPDLGVSLPDYLERLSAEGSLA